MNQKPNHPLLGAILREKNLVTEQQLVEALQIQKRTNVRLGQVLVGLGYINRLTLANLLAEQLDLPFVNLFRDPPPDAVVRLLDEATARRLDAIPVKCDGSRLWVAFSNPLCETAIREIRDKLQRPVEPMVTGEFDIRWILERVYRQRYTEKSTVELLYRHPEESAAETVTTFQLSVALGVLVLGLVCLLLAPLVTLTVVNALVTFVYLFVAFYRLFLAYRGSTLSLPDSTPAEEMANLKDEELPIYTILVPLFGEKEVLPALIHALANLDYPTNKLDIKLLFEESDAETLRAAKALRPPAHFQFIVVPDSEPRTKPKACNYGLIAAVGKYCVIYDAEDVPDADQLKKAVVQFRHAPPNVICLQAKLNYYNRTQNTLTRWFTSEYSMWFDLMLPGLDATNVPIPLGGTSNHFITEKLRALGAWDPFNVTEDADLGVRLHKEGYRTAILDSTTLEEANSELYNWMRQRSRWIKGYMQTWLVHLRKPAKLLRSIGLGSFLSFQMVVGGTAFTFLINPFFWVLTTLWFMTKWDLVPMVFPSIIYYLAAFCLLVGNFVFVYLNLIGSYKRKHYEIVTYTLVSPIYWVLMSLAAWRAFYQLIFKPFYWEKTVHGLHLDQRPAMVAVGK